jgi:hypothetical protein
MATEGTARIVTRADDLGSYRSANRAIYDAWKKGILRNSSIIVPGAEFAHAAEMFRGEKGFCIGLHSAVTCEWNNVRWKPLLPVDTVRSIVDEQGALRKSVQDIHAHGVVFAHILAEIQAQLDKARKAGLDIKYVDGHMAFGWLFEGTDDTKRVAEPMAKWAEKEGLICAAWGNKLPLSRLPVEAKGEERIAAIAAAIRTLAAGDYIMVSHPMYGDDPEVQPATYGTAQPGQIARQRDVERRMFMDPVIVAAAKERGLKPIRYDEM